MKVIKRMKVLFFGLMMFAALCLTACGGGGGGSTPSNNTSGGTISGVAATGSPIVGVTVTVVDSKGNTLTASKPTGSDGSFSISGTGSLTPPLLLQIKSNTGVTNGTTLYSVSAGTSATQTINITPLTDMIIRTYYQVQGTDADTAFKNLTKGTISGTNVPPTPADVATIAATVKTIVQSVLAKAGITVSSFDPIAGTLTPGSGTYDAALDNIKGYTPTATGVSVGLYNGSTVIVTPSTTDGTVTQTTIASTGQSSTTTLSAANYTASGTYTFTSGTLTINTTVSTFPCNGPEEGKTESWTVTNPMSSTSMKWTKTNDSTNVMVWTASGAVNGMTGTWTYTDLSTGAKYTATFSNGTFSVSGTATSCTESSSSGSSSSGSTATSVEGASGTYTYDGTTLSIYPLSSSFINCTGPTAGQSQSFAVTYPTATTMTWKDAAKSDTLNWTRAGSGTGLAGTWTMTDRSTGNVFTATVNSNNTWAVVATVVSYGSNSCDVSSGSTTGTGAGTYYASGTSNGSSTFTSGGTLTINATTSNFPCNGPQLGVTKTWTVGLSGTTMTWTNGSNSTNWTASGAVSGVAGTWTETDSSGSYTAIINPDGSWSITGTLVTACGGSSSPSPGDGTYSGTFTLNDSNGASDSGTFTTTLVGGVFTNTQYTWPSGGIGIPDTSGSVNTTTGDITATAPAPSGCSGSEVMLTGSVDPTGAMSMTLTRNASGTCDSETGTITAKLVGAYQSFNVPVSVSGTTTYGTSVQVCVNYGGNSACGPNGGFAIGNAGSIAAMANEGTSYTVTVPSNQPMATYCSVTSGGSGSFGSSSTMPSVVVNCQ